MEFTEIETAKMLYRNNTSEVIIESNNGGRSFARNVEANVRKLGDYRFLSPVFSYMLKTITATESNTVYVPTLKATTGVSTKKLTISSIDPTDVFMHSEIIDASSDVSFSRVLANTSSTKTDGYVEILYKASSGVTCSAYIDSTDVTLTADDGWHKLEQGCDPAHGVEIHINNSSPVTDATLEVISKVYYI